MSKEKEFIIDILGSLGDLSAKPYLQESAFFLEEYRQRFQMLLLPDQEGNTKTQLQTVINERNFFSTFTALRKICLIINSSHHDKIQTQLENFRNRSLAAEFLYSPPGSSCCSAGGVGKNPILDVSDIK